MFNLKNKVAVITGASSGLGAQMAKGFASQGADLVLLARRLDRLEANAAELKKMGVKCLTIQCDVTDTESVNNAAEMVEKECGKVDILINNAGAAKNAGVLDMTDEEWNFTIDTDLTSVFLVTRAVCKYHEKE